jgi:hypothetical protein
VGANKIKVRALIGDLATQLSHDIRSPLAALNVAISDLKEVPEERRILIRSAVQRIEDIANDLASRKEGVPSTSLGAGRGEGLGVSEEKISDTDEKKKTHHLVSAVQAIVSEKRTEHQQRKNITLETRFEENAYQLFAKIQPSEFKRILSNIVNNSYEAIVGSGSGEIHLSVVEKESSILVIVHDTGCGISQDKLPHLMQRGASFGKEGGQGLGLFHAKETIESWGGAIAIESQEGVGTTVTLSLPKQPTPDWFAAEVVVARDQHVVILDDDESIHLVWKGRLRKQGIDEDCVCHFTTPEQLIDWFRRPETRNLKPETFLFLCDYELIGSIKTGLDVIKELHPVESAQGAAPLCGDSTGVNIANQCVLVTSHYEEKEIRDECKRLGIKLLPKGLAGFVPISVVSKCLSVEVPKLGRVDCDVILIDDEEMIHSTWELMARMKKKKIAHFNHPHEFLKDINNYSPQTPIYIDSDLGNGVKGEIIAQEIFNKGFKEIYLCTGSEPKEYPQMTWIKEVVSKTPRFV